MAALALAVVAVAAAMFLLLRREPAAGPSSRPSLNVLLITLDTTRADHLGSYGHAAARTPLLDRLAAAGARFERAYSPVPITAPAHASILTGLYPFEHGVRNNGDFYLADRFETLATILGQSGYRTAAFVSSFVLDRRYGFARGFDVYDDRLDNEAKAGQIVDLEAERRGDRTVAAFDAWLDQAARDGASPLFAWLHLYDPHSPYSAPGSFGEEFANSPYDGEIAFVDSLLAGVMEHLAKAGLQEPDPRRRGRRPRREPRRPRRGDPRHVRLRCGGPRAADRLAAGRRPGGRRARPRSPHRHRADDSRGSLACRVPR